MGRYDVCGMEEQRSEASWKDSSSLDLSISPKRFIDFMNGLTRTPLEAQLLMILQADVDALEFRTNFRTISSLCCPRS
jgi:hypothetical protein